VSDEKPDWGLGCITFVVGASVGFLLALALVYWAITLVANYNDDPVSPMPHPYTRESKVTTEMTSSFVLRNPI
jgi:hypothetical protein